MQKPGKRRKENRTDVPDDKSDYPGSVLVLFSKQVLAFRPSSSYPKHSHWPSVVLGRVCMHTDLTDDKTHETQCTGKSCMTQLRMCHAAHANTDRKIDCGRF